MSVNLRKGQLQQEIYVFAGQPWMQYAWLLMITLFAAVLRFHRLGEWSFWIDEIFTIDHAVSHFSSVELLLKNIPPFRNWIPLSVIVTAQMLKLGGINEWTARLTAAIIGILTIPILYFPTRKIFGPRIALISGILLAVSPWHLYWSQNARFYTSLFLFYSLALITFYFALECNKPGYFVLFYGLLYFAFSERLFAFFIFPVIGVYLVTLWLFKFEKPPGATPGNLLLLSLPLLAGAAIELYNWTAYGESRFFADFNWFFLYRSDDPIRLLGTISFDIGIALMVLAFFSGLFVLLRRDRASLLMIVSAVVPLVMLVAVNPFIFTKDRYIFMILFSWIVLAAVAIDQIFERLTGQYKWLAVGVFMLLLADAGGDMLLYFRANHGNRAEWKTAFYTIQEKSQPDDVVVTYWPEFGPFYLDRKFIQYEKIDVPTLLNSGKRYWFVMDAETIWANPEVKGFLEKNGQLIDIRYLRTPDDFFLKIYLFDPSLPSPG